MNERHENSLLTKVVFFKLPLELAKDVVAAIGGKGFEPEEEKNRAAVADFAM